MKNRLHKYIYIVNAILLIYLTWEFVSEESRNFFSLNYDWSKEKIIRKVDEVTLDSLSDNYLQLSTSHKINSKPFHSFKLDNDTGTFYFRYTYSIANKEQIIFKGLIWINKQPKISSDNLFKLSEVDLPIKNVKGIDVVTIGDKQFYQNEAKYFRRELRRREDVNFLGKKKDLYGFNYLDFKDLNYSQLDIPKVEYIIIIIKPKPDIYNEFKRLKEFILKSFSEEKMKKVILITQPIYEDTDQYIVKYNKMLLNFSKEMKNIICIDLQSVFKDNSNYFRKNINEISKEGYERIAKEVFQLF